VRQGTTIKIEVLVLLIDGSKILVKKMNPKQRIEQRHTDCKAAAKFY
jgi:hypothetical protein